MRPDHWQELDRVFHSALQREPAERGALLDKECAGNMGLRREVEALLAAHQEAGSFIEKPAIDIEARSIAKDGRQVIAGQTMGHYRIITQLGAGGMGEVYLAEDTRLDRKVALKILPATAASDRLWMSRFVQEAKAASALNHPNIITIHEIDKTDSTHFIAMEFIDGETLRDRLKRGQMKLSEVLDVATQMASAITAAHGADIVHRDIKPENIMLRRDGLVKVLDFGVAKLTPAPAAVETEAATKNLFRTEPGIVVGTLGYMSPEQAHGLDIDARTDIFSFGVVLYEMIAGCLPFQGVTPSEVLAAILNEKEPPPLARFAREVPAELAHLVSKALRKDREQRYQTAKDLLIDLKDLKHELERQAEAERSAPPHVKAAATTPVVAVSTRSLVASNAEYVINQVKRHKLATIVSLLVVAVAVTAALLWYFKPARAGPILTDKDTILLADFENRTDDEVFNGTLKQGLAVQLGQSPFLSIFSDRDVRDMLKLMKRQPDERVTSEVAREICERQALKAFITGSIAVLGSQYVLTLEAVSGLSGEVLAREQAEAQGKEQVLTTLSAMVIKLRERLGESLNSVERFSKPLEQVTTSSLEALRAFSLGSEKVNKGAPLEAVPFYKRATELDPNFAMAYRRLAVAYHNAGQFGMMAEFAAKAYALRDRVTEKERLAITDRYYAYVTLEWDKHIDVLEVYKRTYPRDQGAPLNLAADYWVVGQFQKAVEEAREAIRRAPNKNNALVHLNLPEPLISLNRFDEAKEASQRVLDLQFEGADPHGFLYQIAFVHGDAPEMKKHLDWARGRPDEYVALDWQADTAAFAGQWQRAQDFSRQAITFAEKDARDWAARFAAKASAYGAVFGQCAQATQSAEQAFDLNRDLRPLPGALLGLALCGEVGRALTPANAHMKRYAKDTLLTEIWLPPVYAAVELRRGNAGRALELLQPVARYEGASWPGPDGFWPQYLRGQAFLKVNRGSEAATEFQKILDHRGYGPLSPLYPLAHLGLARAASLMSDTEKSRKAYEAFFSLWKDADPDIPILQQARREYTKLK